MALNKSQFDYYQLDLPWQSHAVPTIAPHLKRAKIRANKQKSTTLHKTPASQIFAPLVNFSKMLSISAAVFFISFIGINWQSYSQVIGSWYQNITGRNIQANLIQDTEINEEMLKINKNPDEQKKDIPPIYLEVVPPDTRIFIASINKNVPVVPVPTEKLSKSDWKGLEGEIQKALQNGVIHYPGTAWPNQEGNVFLTGHSSYYPWDPGRFKDVFALLHEVNLGDKVEMYYQQKKYVYVIDEIKTVKPKDIDVLSQPKGEYKITLMTCTPIGTNINRKIVSGHLVE